MRRLYRKGQISLEYYLLVATLLAFVTVIAGFFQNMGAKTLSQGGNFLAEGEAYSYMAYWDSLNLHPYLQGESDAYFVCTPSRGCYYVKDANRAKVKSYALSYHMEKMWSR